MSNRRSRVHAYRQLDTGSDHRPLDPRGLGLERMALCARLVEAVILIVGAIPEARDVKWP